ncbi:sigma factor regulator N-terminal domain-containing protein [Vagococcus sp.]|uniref:sigma factor regulator N-terminal domain-containing protein n=1 Tax=Vagococcus sp. TaxID=1933889 RepID=UPI003F9C7E5D
MENLPNLDNQFKKIAKKNRRNRWLIPIIVTIITFFIVFVGGWKITQFFATKQYQTLNEQLILIEDIQSPNIHADSRYIEYSNFFGGTIVSNRYRNIDGYPLPIEDARGKYTIFHHHLLNFNHSPTFLTNDKGEYVANISRESRQLVPTFYNRNQNTPRIPLKNDLAVVNQLKGKLAEVSITFDQPYTQAEIKKMIPDNLLINWFWIGTYSKFDTSDLGLYLGLNSDQKTNSFLKEDFEAFTESLKKANQDFGYTIEDDKQEYSLYKDGALYAKKQAKFEEAKFGGIIISGRTSDLAKLANAKWIYGASIGESVDELPQIPPTKK